MVSPLLRARTRAPSVMESVASIVGRMGQSLLQFFYKRFFRLLGLLPFFHG